MGFCHRSHPEKFAWNLDAYSRSWAIMYPMKFYGLYLWKDQKDNQNQVSMPIVSQRGEQKGDIVISKLTDRVQC